MKWAGIWTFAALAGTFALASPSVGARAAEEELGAPVLSAILKTGIDHNGDTRRYTGRMFHIADDFSHMDHHDDYAAVQRPDHARAFEVIASAHVKPPARVNSIFIRCVLPATDPLSKLADTVPLGQDPPQFNHVFRLRGAVASVEYEQSPGFATLVLAPGCTVEPVG